MKALKSDRSIVPYILLGIITLGIYNIWYLHRLVKDVNLLCREYGRQSSGVVAYILLSLLTCGGYAVFWWYRIGDMLSVAARKREVKVDISPSFIMICFVLSYVVCGIASYVGIHKVFEATNALADDYNETLRTRYYYEQTEG